MEGFNTEELIQKADVRKDTDMCKENLEKRNVDEKKEEIMEKELDHLVIFPSAPPREKRKIKQDFDFIWEKVAYKKISDLVENCLQPDELTAEYIDKICADVEKYNLPYPLLLDNENKIIVGNDVFRAALKLNMHKLPIVYKSDLSPDDLTIYFFETHSIAQHTNDWGIYGFAFDEVFPLYLEIGEKLGHGLRSHEQ